MVIIGRKIIGPSTVTNSTRWLQEANNEETFAKVGTAVVHTRIRGVAI